MKGINPRARFEPEEPDRIDVDEARLRWNEETRRIAREQRVSIPDAEQILFDRWREFQRVLHT
ncbi:hypothetical protein [Arsenicibacter rosenii]|uniref:Uncharacterized protein n=1 Tax=Arsenicibacter rosenii TaxID=1750698 RepID=A0A1S2VM43_9BACT|nr:hypothetical protein [Arsenicibacter rosenii]OIN59841.1 hypothetical protein BLX24_08255 [Arsenicibacter rosenii]